MTLRQALSWASGRLSQEEDLALTAMRDAEVLLLHVLALPRSTIYAHPGRLLSTSERLAFEAAVFRRWGGEPIQYITGKQEFFGFELEVGPGVLIPRPETELLVEAAVERLPHDRAVRVLDVGTGSGAIAIAVASRLPLARILAVDVSTEALEVAARNVTRHGLGARVELAHSDLIGIPAADGLGFDAVLSNPPYVPERDRASLHRQVREYEPEGALFAGEDGLLVYRRLIPEAQMALGERGLLAMEIGFGQRAGVAELLEGWSGVQFLDDLQGVARVVVARRSSHP